MKKNIIPAILAIILSASCEKSVQCGKDMPEEITEPVSEEIAVESISLDKDAVNIAEGDSIRLTMTIFPENATNMKVNWTCDNSEVATVNSEGTVTGSIAGETIVTVTTEDGSKSASCPVTVFQKPNGNVLSGEFSVSAGKKVRFSKGNLYFDGNAFQFEANQYESPAKTDTSHIGHFFWSKSAAVATAGSYSESGTSAEDIFFTNAGIDTPNPGFIVGETAGAFRTLSPAEWQYIFKTRSDASKLFAKGVTICGKKNCIVIAPDGFDGTIASSYNSQDWKKAEKEGLVCLPAAGYRDGSNINNAGDVGYYWASSASYGGVCSNIVFDNGNISPASYALRFICYSVRLVTE